MITTGWQIVVVQLGRHSGSGEYFGQCEKWAREMCDVTNNQGARGPKNANTVLSGRQNERNAQWKGGAGGVGWILRA